MATTTTRTARLATLLSLAILARGALAHEERDLVCGMMVDVDHAEWVFDHEGRRYYFCDRSDLEIFRENPDSFVAALKLSRATPARRYDCTVRPRQPVAPGAATIVLAGAGLEAAPARARVEAYFVDRRRPPAPETIRLVRLGEDGKLGFTLSLDRPGDVRLLFRIVPEEGAPEEIVAFGFPVAPAPETESPAIAALSGGPFTMDAQHHAMKEMGELWAGVAERLAVEPADLDGTKEPLARVRALSTLLPSYSLHRFPEAMAEMVEEGAVFEKAVVSLLLAVAKGDAREARERFATIDAMSCTKCHYKFRFGVIDDVSRFPDLREREEPGR